MDIPDAILVEQCRRGDRRAFERLYERYGKGLYGFVRRMVGSPEDAEDLAEETFVRAWSGLSVLRDPEAFRTWLFRIAVRLVQDYRKARGGATVSLSEMPDPAASPQDGALRDERTAEVRAAVAQLSPEHREVVALFYDAEMRVEEIADALGLRKGTVVSRLARARAALRERLVPYVRPTEVRPDAV